MEICRLDQAWRLLPTRGIVTVIFNLEESPRLIKSLISRKRQNPKASFVNQNWETLQLMGE
jgi:hypothetical protein